MIKSDLDFNRLLINYKKVTNEAGRESLRAVILFNI